MKLSRKGLVRLVKTLVAVGWIPMTMLVGPFLFVWGREWGNGVMWISGLTIMCLGGGIPILLFSVDAIMSTWEEFGNGEVENETN